MTQLANFMSDNAAAACPEVMAAVMAAGPAQPAGYDGDDWSRRLDAVFEELFGRPCAVLAVGTGTAANALALACLVPPWGAVACHTEAHVHVDECGAPEFFTGGAKLLLCPGDHGKLTPASVAAGLSSHRGDVHQVQMAALSITQATECGTVYRPHEVAALAAHARAQGWRVHMDGARFANAAAFLGGNPADMVADVDALSFGCIKNGGLGAEAIVLFDCSLADQLRWRRKRAGQMPSKGRFNAAQILAMVEDGVWLRNAAAANAGAQVLAQAAGERLLHPVEANEVFVQLAPGEPERLRAQGFLFYDWGAADSNEARLVVSWDTPAEDAARLAAALAAG
ncbi:beta-eliminating lyase-related protein [Sandarakinorhabdus sp.]|uniref:threonine aldolase family protein n=1 Tax=Sandarakinorhabdus sp. TaxID=1916663 RepID=UPI0033426957